MSQRLKRLIASVSGWVAVLFVAMVVTFFIFASGQMLANTFYFSILIVIPATILAPIWELGGRRVWLAILLVAVNAQRVAHLLGGFRHRDGWIIVRRPMC